MSHLYNAIANEIVNKALQGAIVNERRNSLLWWRETLYSLSFKRGYRSLSSAVATVTMAYDLHLQMPAFYPQSVEYLLRETVRATLDVREESGVVSVTAFCRDLLESEEKFGLIQLLGQSPEEHERIPLLDFIKQILTTQNLDSQNVRNKVGIDPEKQISFGNLAVWLFRDLQARKLTISKKS